MVEIKIVCKYIKDFEYEFNGHIIKIIPINSFNPFQTRKIENQILNISEFYLDGEYIAKIYFDYNIKETVLDCNKDCSKFDYIEKIIKWLKDNDSNIYDQYASYSYCDYLKIDGYVD